MLDEQQVWADARASRGVSALCVSAFAKAYVKAEHVRQVSANRAAMWAKKRFTRWLLVFAPLGFTKLTTSRLANSMGRTNSGILKDLDNLVADGLVIRDGTQAHPGNGNPLQLWTWIGERK